MPVASEDTEPPELVAIAVENGMCPRERDLMRLDRDFPMADNAVKGKKVVEFKHSAPRVFHHAGQKHGKPSNCASTILPASKIFLFLPVTQSPRLFAYICSKCLLCIR